MTKSPRPLVIWGATGQAKVVAEFAPALGYGIVALFDNDPALKSPFPSIPLFHGREGFERWRASSPGPADFVVAVGGARNAERLELIEALERAGMTAATLIHPTAFVAASARIGAGCQILAQSSVCAEVSLGAGCIVNTAASVDHECELGEGVHVGPGAVLCGCVKVGRCGFIGAGAVVMPRISIGADAIVAAGAVVSRNVAPNRTVAGVPASPLEGAEKGRARS